MCFAAKSNSTSFLNLLVKIVSDKQDFWIGDKDKKTTVNEYFSGKHEPFCANYHCFWIWIVFKIFHAAMAQNPTSTEDTFNKLAFFRYAFINYEVKVFFSNVYV